MPNAPPSPTNRAWPTIISQTAGFLWCSDCGAFRLIES
jgi:hypothetical protein